jgi:hypothetical protein
MSWDDDVSTLKAVRSRAGKGWRVFIQWTGGPIQYVNGFDSSQDAETWIKEKAEEWLRKLKAKL